MRNKFIIVSLFFLPFITISSCNTRNITATTAYLNRKYQLTKAGDIHGAGPFDNLAQLNRTKGYTDYTYLFDLTKSYINFQTQGDSFENLKCVGSFSLYDKKGLVTLEVNSFLCEYSGGQTGNIVFLDNGAFEIIGKIYVHTPYWCRCELLYEIEENPEPVLLTFEYWTISYNELPEILR